MAGETILLVDDEQNILDLARLYLEAEGFQVLEARDGERALEIIQQREPDLIVLDLMLPKVDGWDVCRRTRARSDVPIIMLTARSDDVDKIVGLELGADDYLTKPFNPREPVARVKAVLRRAAPAAPAGRPITIGRVTIDPARREVRVDGEPVEPRTKEFDLPHTLAEHRGIVMSREKLLNLVWGYDFYGETRTVDYQVDKSRSGRRGGWGLGLAIARELVEAMGGRIRAESVQGLGSRFTVTLPAQGERQAAPGGS